MYTLIFIYIKDNLFLDIILVTESDILIKIEIEKKNNI